MKSSHWNRSYIAFFFQMVFFFYLLAGLFQAIGSAPAHARESSKPLLCINGGNPAIIRAAAAESAFSPALIKNFSLGSFWVCAERVLTRTLLGNFALKVSSGIYNTYYILLTIHAP